MIHEAVVVKADAEHVDAEPGEAGDDVAKDGHEHEAAFADDAAPACMEDGGVPDDDHEGAVFLGIPAPESPPGLIGPDAAKDGADEAEECGKADDAVDHAAEGFGGGGVEALGEEAAKDVDDGKEACEEGGGVS